MKRSLTADDVIREIEFELIQGAISKDELGQGIQTVKKFQNQIRSEFFNASSQSSDQRDYVSRQFQINDMLTTLLQEMAATIQSLRLELHQSTRLSERLSLASSQERRAAQDDPQRINLDSTDTSPTSSELRQPHNLPRPLAPLPLPFDQELPWRSPTEIEDAMQEEALDIRLDVREAGIPILGGLIKSVRMALHNLTLFYVGRLAKKQTPINQTYGDWLLHLNQQNQQQQEQIAALTEQVLALSERIEAGTLPSEELEG